METRNVVIVDACRTAVGKMGGACKPLSALDMAVATIQGNLDRSGIDPEEIDEVILGQCRQTSDEPNIARVAALKVGIPEKCAAYTVMRQCASGMTAVQNGVMSIMTGVNDVVIAGGTESMSTPSTRTPALKSIQLVLFVYSGVLVEIFIVGTNVPNGVPLPVVNNTMWHPAAASAVEATRSLPGAESRFRPWFLSCSPYSRTPLTGALPLFCVHPRALSSSVDIPPALLPGEGFSPTGSPCERKYSLKLLIKETV